MTLTSSWTHDQLGTIGDATELRIATYRLDGTARDAIPIWHVRVGDGIFIRSAHGPDNGWFRRAKSAGIGHIESGGIATDVTFETAPAALADDITATYHQKYDRYGAGPVGAVTGDDVLETTLQVMPRERTR